MTTPFSQHELIERIRWYTTVRWFVVLGIGIPGIASLSLHNDFFTDDQILLNVGVLIMVLLINALILASTYVPIRISGFYELLSVFQVVFDITIMTAVFQLNGGIETTLIILYAIPIIMSGIMLSKKAIYVTGFSATTIFFILSLLDFTDNFKPSNIDVPPLHDDPAIFIPTFVTTTMVLVVITFISDFVAHFVRRSSVLDQELKGVRLDAAKVASIIQAIPSSVAVVDEVGKIVMVNNAFEQLMDVTSAEVRGEKVIKIIHLVNERGKPVKNLETSLRAVLRRKKFPLEPVPLKIDEHFIKRPNGTVFSYSGSILSVVVEGRSYGAAIVFDKQERTITYKYAAF